jgi:hypothetical protein
LFSSHNLYFLRELDIAFTCFPTLILLAYIIKQKEWHVKPVKGFMTKELRNERNLKLAIKQWMETSFIGKIWKVKIGKIIIFTIISFFVLSLLSSLHIIEGDAIQMIADIFKWINKAL